ncbi:major facilitator superfamily domain-containing protein 4A [Procambarus clarkii]|uniref:major facilitator superfamily domain-containing protein 4A n=1 Tax=Procambarus clarkii TaxID=6728 RepID=UPI001E670E20|nr:major facilitator superfamily domain-containing protein 4A-like isoform X2 [Procambarus clarkii]
MEESPQMDKMGGVTNGTVGGAGILGHAKELCVNKMGHTMVPRPVGGNVKFRELFWKNRLQTVTYCAVFWSFGMCVAFLGPTLLDLECRISSVFSSMSWIFFSQSLFTLIGSACGGFLIQRLGNHVVLLLSTTMLAVTLAVIPYCTVLGWLAAVLALMGFFMGTIDTVANISMIQLYGMNVAPFLQALHFFYGLGAFLSPMIAEPFLLNKNCTEIVLNTTTTTSHHHHDQHQHTQDKALNLSYPDHHTLELKNNSEIQYAFWILSGLQVPVVLLLTMLVGREVFGLDADPAGEVAVGAGGSVEAGKEAYEMKVSSGGTEPKVVVVEHGERPPVNREQVVTITLLTALLLFLYDGLQAGYGGYVFSYAVKSIAGMSMNEAAYLNACFWGTFAFGRLMSIGIATKLAPSFMLLCNISGCLVAMVLMLSFHHNHAVLYIGTCIFGTFLSSVYPTAVSLAETYIPVTSHITSGLVMTAAAGEMIIPVVIGHEFEAYGPASVLVSGVVMTLVSVVVYLLLYLVAQTITRQSSEQSLLKRLKALLLRQKEEMEDSGLMKHHVKYYTRMASQLSESSLGEEAGSPEGTGPRGQSALSDNSPAPL